MASYCTVALPEEANIRDVAAVMAILMGNLPLMVPLDSYDDSLMETVRGEAKDGGFVATERVIEEKIDLMCQVGGVSIRDQRHHAHARLDPFRRPLPR